MNAAIYHTIVFSKQIHPPRNSVVFDGSAKTDSGFSLNHALIVGPTIQEHLFSIPNCFRFTRIPLSADVAKIYPQVALDCPDKDFHRILWRDTSADILKHYHMKRVTWGVASSAFHSTRCLQEVANRSTNEMVKDSLKKSFHVDDFLGGANNKEEARELIKDVCQELKNWL